MALTQTLLQIRNNVRKLADVEGTTALLRHPDADLNDYINRGIAAFYRLLSLTVADQRFTATSTLTTSSGTANYSLAADFDSLISIDVTANGVKSWIVAYEMNERPALTDPATSYTGIPFTYRLRGSNIELLPTPGGTYTVTLWYVPATSQLVSDSDTVDTIVRLDDYIIAYAARLIAVKDKNFDLAQQCSSMMGELEPEIRTIARARDRNSPSRIVDESQMDRWGRRRRLPGRWR